MAVSGCNQPSVHTHTFAEEWTSDEDSHWHVCTGCEEISDKAEHTWDEGVVTTEATENLKGVKTYTCTVCNKTKIEEIAKLEHVHTFAEEWSYSDDYHWHAATCKHTTEVSNKAEHSWDDGVVTTEATCVSKGLKEYKCTVCGKVLRTEEFGEVLYSTPVDAETNEAATASIT